MLVRLLFKLRTSQTGVLVHRRLSDWPIVSKQAPCLNGTASNGPAMKSGRVVATSLRRIVWTTRPYDHVTIFLSGGFLRMSTYPWQELLKRWARAELSPEQAIGQLLQWGEATTQQLNTQTLAVAALQRQVTQLSEQVARLLLRDPKQP